jgi:hypothetical protein
MKASRPPGGRPVVTKRNGPPSQPFRSPAHPTPIQETRPMALFSTSDLRDAARGLLRAPTISRPICRRRVPILGERMPNIFRRACNSCVRRQNNCARRANTCATRQNHCQSLLRKRIRGPIGPKRELRQLTREPKMATSTLISRNTLRKGRKSNQKCRVRKPLFPKRRPEGQTRNPIRSASDQIRAKSEQVCPKRELIGPMS